MIHFQASSMTSLMIALQSFDLVVTLTSITMFSFNAFRYSCDIFMNYYRLIFPYIIPYVLPVALMAQTGSAYMTVCIAVER